MKMKKEVMELLKELSINYDESVVDKYIEAVKSKKINELLGLNEENNFRKEISLQIDMSKLFKSGVFQYVTFYYYQHKIPVDLYKNRITEDAPDKKAYSKGQKLTKWTKDNLKKIHDFYPNSEVSYTKFKEAFDKFAIEYGEHIKERKMYVSTNLSDMLTSASKSSFTSCFDLHKDQKGYEDGYRTGEYSSSPFVYALDAHVGIVYTSEAKNPQRKIGRTYLFTNSQKTKLVTGKIYGTMNESNLKELLSTVNTFDSKKIHKGKFESFLSVSKGDCNNMYLDSGFQSFMISNASSEKTTNSIKLKNSICISCGGETSTNEVSYCEKCRKQNMSGCSSCSSGRYYKNDTMHIDPDTKKLVCARCFNTKYKVCGICGEYHNKEHMRVISNKHICNTCHKKMFRTCADCGQYFVKDAEDKAKTCPTCTTISQVASIS